MTSANRTLSIKPKLYLLEAWTWRELKVSGWSLTSALSQQERGWPGTWTHLQTTVMSSDRPVLLAPHAATAVVVSPSVLGSPRTVLEVISWRREQEFTVHFPFRNAKPLVSCSLHMQSTSLEDLQLYFNGYSFSPCYPVSRERVCKWVFQPRFCLQKNRAENHQLYHTVCLSKSLLWTIGSSDPNVTAV